jgi:hypothetical protein
MHFKTIKSLQITLQKLKEWNSDWTEFITGEGNSGVEKKMGRYTSQGAGDASTTPGKNFLIHWQILHWGLRHLWGDIWHKPHTAKKRCDTLLATVEGKVYWKTIAEVANSYYEITSFGQQTLIVKQNIALQKKRFRC